MIQAFHNNIRPASESGPESRVIGSGPGLGPVSETFLLAVALAALVVVGITLSGQSRLLPASLLEQIVGTASAANERAFVEVERSRGLPVRGQTRASVERQFGAPTGSKPAVGQPPISSWKYDGFIVYFEYDHVITTVADQDHLPTGLGDIQ